MTKLEAVLSRVLALPKADQDAIADELEAWLAADGPGGDGPASEGPASEGPASEGPDGSDDELRARLDAWRRDPIATNADDALARQRARLRGE